MMRILIIFFALPQFWWSSSQGGAITHGVFTIELTHQAFGHRGSGRRASQESAVIINIPDQLNPDRGSNSVANQAQPGYPHCAFCRSAWSIKTSAVIASTIGTARGSTQGS